MMECIKGDNGVVTALINFGGLLFGALSMILVTLAFWPNPVLATGVIGFIVSGVACMFWLRIKDRLK